MLDKLLDFLFRKAAVIILPLILVSIIITSLAACGVRDDAFSFIDCLCAEDGSAFECGTSVIVCAGQDCFAACAEDAELVRGCDYSSGYHRFYCAGCTVFCSGDSDPQSPNYVERDK